MCVQCWFVQKLLGADFLCFTSFLQFLGPCCASCRHWPALEIFTQDRNYDCIGQRWLSPRYRSSTHSVVTGCRPRASHVLLALEPASHCTTLWRLLKLLRWPQHPFARYQYHLSALISNTAAVRMNELMSVRGLGFSIKVLKMCYFICTKEEALKWHLLLSFKCQQIIVSTSREWEWHRKVKKEKSMWGSTVWSLNTHLKPAGDIYTK